MDKKNLKPLLGRNQPTKAQPVTPHFPSLALSYVWGPPTAHSPSLLRPDARVPRRLAPRRRLAVRPLGVRALAPDPTHPSRGPSPL
jgi:hypothetical protein